MTALTKDNIFKPAPSKAETKGDMTTKVARSITEGEAASREAKTERLRLARLAREQAEAAMPKPEKKAAGKAKRS